MNEVFKNMCVVNFVCTYIQGFHDICVTVLLVIGEELSFPIVNELCQTHFRYNAGAVFFMIVHALFFSRDFMDISMEKTKDMLNYLYPIVRRQNAALSDYLIQFVTLHTISLKLTSISITQGRSWYYFCTQLADHMVRSRVERLSSRGEAV